MKPLLLTLLLLFMGCNIQECLAQEVNLDIIAQIESNGNPNAYNKRSGAIGLYQITPICLKDYNQHYIRNYGNIPNEKFYYSNEDLYDPIINFRIANWYLNTRIPELLKHYHKPITIDNILWAYNAGIGNLVKGIKPLETRNYIKKYHKLEKEVK